VATAAIRKQAHQHATPDAVPAVEAA